MTFTVTPNAQATVENFTIAVEGFDTALLQKNLTRAGQAFFPRIARRRCRTNKIRFEKENYLAPELDEPRVVYDSETNKINIAFTGKKGPLVEVTVEAERDKIGEGTQDRLLPLKREGTLDYAAIIEGERKLENHYQEQGYFFVDVIPVCAA